MAAPSRPYHRTVITHPGVILCVCRARAGYRLSRGGQTLYRCPACASHYDNAEWTSEALPHIAAQHEATLFEAYVHHREHGFSPEAIARAFRATFAGRVEELEARYQGGKRAAS